MPDGHFWSLFRIFVHLAYATQSGRDPKRRFYLLLRRWSAPSLPLPQDDPYAPSRSFLHGAEGKTLRVYNTLQAPLGFEPVRAEV